MTDCLVSVIIPTYKRGDVLLRALDSIKDQTYKNLEVVVVNDCVEQEWIDKVTEMVEPYLESINLVLVHNQDKHGSAGARDAGIKVAKGTYVTFLDDDDYYLPEKIESQLSVMLEADADFSITDLEQYNEEGKFVEKRERSYIVSTDNESLFKYHYLYHMTCTDTLMFKKDYLEKIGGFNCADMGDEFYLIEKAIENGGKFCYDRHCYVRTVIHTKEFGVSNGMSKINGEKALYLHKKEKFSRFTKKEIKQITVRYKMVLAYAYYRMKKLLPFCGYMLQAVFTSLPMTVRYLKKR